MQVVYYNPDDIKDNKYQREIIYKKERAKDDMNKQQTTMQMTCAPYGKITQFTKVCCVIFVYKTNEQDPERKREREK